VSEPKDETAQNTAPLQLQQQLLNIGTAVRATLEQIERSITESIEETVRQIQETTRTLLEELPQAAREALTILGQHGWYLDPEMSLPELAPLAESLQRGDSTDAERSLADHYRVRLPQIKQELVSWYPARAGIIMPGFEAHRRGEYVLSIPVLLAQADGICKERLGVSLYSRQKRNGPPVTAKAIKKQELDPIEAAMLHPLEIPLPISASENELKRLLNVLNRHEVLHGISVDYGTEVNSLKAISLLYYVASVLRKRGA